MPVDIISPEQVSYTVDGDSLATLAQVISGQDEAAKAEWFPRYEYEMNGSVVSSVTVTVVTRITMPEWGAYGSASQPEKDEWDRFLAALQSHEQGHLDLVSQYLSNIDEKMTGQSLNGAVSVWKQVLGDLAQASEVYDRQSDHGRNQGTIINLGPVTPAAG